MSRMLSSEERWGPMLPFNPANEYKGKNKKEIVEEEEEEEEIPNPECDICATNEAVEYTGPGAYGSEFWCKKCKHGWCQPV